MEKIVYTKYSNDRSAAFKIRTDIVKREDETLYARKTGLTPESATHIGAMYKNYLALSKQFEGSILSVNHCEREGQNALAFEFIEGHTLEQELDTLLEEEKYDAFLDCIRKFLSVMREAASEDFTKTDVFVEMFGSTPDFTGKKCMKVSDVDLIFQNLVMRNGKWEILDYEWSYAVPIPVDFIIYRALHYYEAGQRHEKLKQICNIFRFCGIRQDECRLYEKMEEHFQSYLTAGNTPLWKIYGNLKGELYFPQGMIAEGKDEDAKHQVRVVKMYADPARNTDTEIHTVPDQNGRIVVDIPMEEDITMLAFYPAKRCCAVTLYEADTFGLSAGRASHFHNGFSLDEKNIYFTVDGPQIIFAQDWKGISVLHLELSVSFPHKASLIAAADNIAEANRRHVELMKCMENNNRQDADIHQLKARADELQTQNDHLIRQKAEQNAQYQSLQSNFQTLQGDYQRLAADYNRVMTSRSYRCMKPFQKITGVLRKIRSKI